MSRTRTNGGEDAYLKMVQQLRAARPETEKIQLFRDNGRYKNDVFASVNGRRFLVQRGVEVELPYAVAAVIKASIRQDTEAARLVSRLRGEARFA